MIFPSARPASNFTEHKQSVHARATRAGEQASEWEWEIPGLRGRGRVRESARECERARARKREKQKQQFHNTTRVFHEEKSPD